MELFRNKQWDIIGKTGLWFTISGISIVVGIAALSIRGLNYGIDFTGGSLLRYQFASPLASSDAEIPQVTAKVRQALDELKLGSSEIQVVGDERGQYSQLYLRTPPVVNDEAAAERSRTVVAKLQGLFKDREPITDLGRETVGPVVGAELRNKAILALCLGYLLILIYITIRYEFRFGVAAVIALAHDVLFVIGCMALFHVELNSGFVAALLTVLGYSNHDTVVIMDRIRENMRVRRRATFAATVNASLLETLARSINLVLTVLFTVVALLLFGGEAIRGFSLALLFGVSTGCYSSVCTAAPIVVLLEGRAARARAQAVAAARGRTGGAAGGAPRPSPTPARQTPQLAEAVEGSEAAQATSSRHVIERLQREEMQERQNKALAETEAQREARRERRKREKERAAKRTGKPKRRF